MCGKRVGLEGAKEGGDGAGYWASWAYWAAGLLFGGKTTKAAGAQLRQERLCERYENVFWWLSGTSVGQPSHLHCKRRTTPVPSFRF